MSGPSTVRREGALARSVTRAPVLWLFGIDMVSNGIDYAFHIYAGWALEPGAFAVVQTVNSVVLVLVTAFAALQPVVARFVVEGGDEAAARAVFRGIGRQSAGIGLALAALTVALAGPLGRALNVPPAAAAWLGGMVLVAVTRPVLAGMLQGQGRFLRYGLTRTAYAAGRLLLALLLVGLLGGGAVAAVAAMPGGGLISLGLAAAFVGGGAWWGAARPDPALRTGRAWRLALAALLAYAAYTGLQALDLIWVNRSFPGATAGSYATLAVLRRVVALFPGAVVVVLFPRVVERAARGERLDGVIGRAAGIVLAATLGLTGLYFALDATLIRLMFGPAYAAAAPLLGWMGLAMVGFGLAAVWLNVFLATRPWPFVGLLGLLIAGQWGVLGLARPATLAGVTAVFAAGAWLAAVGGALLYLAWLRPRLGGGR